ncbi:hypothetical protein NMY22_g15717 [Coprinellus aureogranulatus]|nr:hypothetical protein NMY22_g15717 [Coprinellus aureogranulatus]
MALNRFFCILALSLAWSVSASCLKLDPRQNTTVVTKPSQWGCNLWEWSAPDVKASSGAYRTEAGQNSFHFTTYYSTVQYRNTYSNGYNMDADHLFEAQMAAFVLEESELSYNFMYWDEFGEYRARLNNRQNMIYIDPDINLEKAQCIAGILSGTNPTCSKWAVDYLLWTNGMSVYKMMWATALELDKILYGPTLNAKFNRHRVLVTKIYTYLWKNFSEGQGELSLSEGSPLHAQDPEGID